MQGVFELLTGSDVWPPVGAPAGMVNAALILDPAAVQLYRGLRLTRPGVCDTTLQCSPSFHGRPRQDAVLLSTGPDAADYTDVHSMEYGLVHCFFSYSDAGLRDFLSWGAGKFDVDVDEDSWAQYTQFFLMQRYRPSPAGDALLPLRYYAAKVLSNDYETESVAAIRSRARAFPWFHGTPQDDMKKRKGAIFCQFN